MKKLGFFVLGLICELVVFLFLGTVDAKSETIFITGTDGTIIQTNEQKWEDLELYFLKDQENIKHYTIMDRNLGAKEIYTGVFNIDTVGYYYQWGNNYGFMLGCYTNSCNTFLSGEDSDDISVPYETWSYYMLGNYARNTRSTSPNWIGGSTNENNNLWGGIGDTITSNGTGTHSNRKGPCPEGYYVPSILDWLDVLSERENVQNEFNSLKWGYDLLLFRIGSVSYGTHKHVDLGNNGPYQSSSLKSGGSPYYLVYNSSRIYTGATRTSDARAIRCFKNEANKDNNLAIGIGNFHLNGGVNAVISIDGEKITTLDDPIKTGDDNNEIKFMGRYSTDNFIKGTKINTGDIVQSGMNLYARWSGDNEIVLYQYNANGGAFSGGQTDISNYYAVSGEINTDIVEIPIMIGYIFDGWYDEITGGNKILVEVVNDSRLLYAHRKINQYTITFKDGENEITSITADYGTGITPPANPTKNGYKFIGWEPEIPATMPANDMIINAKWEKYGSSGGGGGGGGGGRGSSSSSSSTGSDTSNQQSGTGTNNSTGTQNDQTTTGMNVNEPEGTGNNAEIQTGNVVDSSEQVPQNDDNSQMDSLADKSASEGQTNSQGGSTYSEEFQQAYEFAKGNGITTMPTIQKADMNGNLTRIAMAKMLSQYAINVLGQKPANIVTPKFNDISEQRDEQYDNGVTLAYQLGIMGQNMPNNNFRPDDEVTRAEFATALSRMLYATSDGIYKSTSEYYTNHMKKLKEEGIITKDDPKMKELRGYVMIMLMRSAE